MTNNNSNPAYYAVLTADVRYDKRLTPNAKLLYSEITALANQKGYCWSTNSYFAELYSVSNTSISKWISQLIEFGYLKSNLIYKEGTKEILHRYLSLVKGGIEDKLNTPIEEMLHTPIEDKLKGNSTVINNTNINNTFNNLLMSEIKISDLETFLPNEVEYFNIADSFRKLFIKNQTEKGAPVNNQEKAKYKNYVSPIRLSFEKDGVTKEQFKIVFKYLDSPQGEFWKSHILSTKKLREKFTQLIMKAKETSKQNSNRGFVADADYFKKVYESDIAKTFKFK